MNPLKILLIEAYTDANIGSGALVENSVALLRNRYPGCKIRVMAHNPEVFVKLCEVDAVQDVFQYPFGKSRIRQGLWLIWTLGWMATSYLQALLFPRNNILFCRHKVRDLLWADAVVSVGAERINDKFVKNIIFSLFTYAIAKRLGRKVILFPCTIGPFLYGWTRSLSAHVLKHTDLIYTRDKQSTTITLSLADMPKEKVVSTCDVAVFQSSISREAALRKLDLKVEQPIVGISVMRWTYVANKAETRYSNYESYAREMATLADRLMADYCATVVFYPTNYPVHGCREDDVAVAREIQSLTADPLASRIIDELPTPAELKGMLACSEVNITTRMHACILSTGAGVPTISINYLFKLSEYMESLGLADFSFDIEDFNAEETLNAFAVMWKERLRWREVIEAAVKSKQQNLLVALERMDCLLDHDQVDRLAMCREDSF